ncbi:hypothetical protein BGM09_15455 [Streptomyces sp. CBMA29]|nr:hypothetical protein [Streptomyces sp. CBMA29]
MAGLLQVAALPAAQADDMPRTPSPGVPVAGHSSTTTAPRAEDGLPHRADDRAAEKSWAAPGTATVTLPAAHAEPSAVRAGKLPVTLTVPAAATSATARGSAKASAAPLSGAATVRVLDRETTRAAGVDGLLFTVAPRADAEGGTVGVRVDASAYAQAYGGAYAARLRLVTLPACALTTPGKAACTTRTPVRATNDAATHTLTADALTLASSGASGTATVLAATAGTSSDHGDYTATSLSPSSNWNVGPNTGSFTWSYDMPAPDVPGSFTPKVGRRWPWTPRVMSRPSSPTSGRSWTPISTSAGASSWTWWSRASWSRTRPEPRSRSAAAGFAPTRTVRTPSPWPPRHLTRLGSGPRSSC